MIFDGNDLSSVLVIENIDRPVMPPVQVEADDRAGDGSVLRRIRLEPLSIGVDARLVRPYPELGPRRGFDRAKRELAGMLFRRRPCELVLDDRPDVYNMAVLDDSTDLEKLGPTQALSMRFYCSDPVCYSRDETERRSEGGTVTCRVGGNFPTAPVIELQSSYDNDAVIVDGRPMRAVGAGTDAGTLVFDCSRRRVEKDGEPVTLYLGDDYAEWAPGLHAVTCDRPFTVRWRELWI